MSKKEDEIVKAIWDQAVAGAAEVMSASTKIDQSIDADKSKEEVFNTIVAFVAADPEGTVRVILDTEQALMVLNARVVEMIADNNRLREEVKTLKSGKETDG